MSRQTHRDPVLTVDLEAVDLRVVDLIGLGRAGIGQQLRDLLRGDVLLCNDEFHVGLLFGVREPACPTGFRRYLYMVWGQCTRVLTTARKATLKALQRGSCGRVRRRTRAGKDKRGWIWTGTGDSESPSWCF